MALSDVDITNLALSHLGDRANVSSISPPDQSVQAQHAARFYDQVRDELLESFPWKFALRRTTMAPRADIEMGSWAYIYAEPNNCLRIVNVLPGGYSKDDQGVEYDTESDETGQGLVLTNASEATARFIARVTNPAVFTPGFVQTQSWLLAAVLAGPIIKGETGRAEAIRCIQAAQLAYGRATTLSANQARKRLDFLPSAIAARGAVADANADSFPIRT